MIDKELFWKIFEESTRNCDTPILLEKFLRSDNHAAINTGYRTLLSKLFIDLHDDSDSFEISLIVGDTLPCSSRVWEFIHSDEDKILSQFIHTPNITFDMNDMRISDRLSTMFPLPEHTKSGYQTVIKDAIPDIITYLKIYRQYVRNIPELLYSIDMRISRAQLFWEVRRKEKKEDTPYLKSDVNEIKSTFYHNYNTDTAHNIYIEYGKQFGWNMSLADSPAFKENKTFLLPKATPEGYGVWFIYDSNYTKAKPTDYEIKFYGDSGKVIDEIAPVQYAEAPEINSRCIVFAQRYIADDKFAFEFLGVFIVSGSEQCDAYGKQVLINTYSMTSNIYENKPKQK